MKVLTGLVLLVLSHLFGAALLAEAPDSGIWAGAARVDITPPKDELILPFAGVADPIFVRALVVESRGKRAAIVIADVPTIGADVHADLSSRIARTAKVPVENIVLGTTHTHNAMRVAHNAKGIILPGSSRFVERVSAQALKAVELALADMQPARMGLGRGQVELTGNRNVWSAKHGRVIADVDRTGTEPVDHSLGLAVFETLDGRPIAYVLNHGFEPVVAMPIKDQISGDVPGDAARKIEARLGGNAVALFTIGAAGVPLYRAEDGGDRESRARSLMDAMGTIFAEEAHAVAAGLDRSAKSVAITGKAAPLVCAGKATSPFNLPDRCAYEPGSSLPACVFVERDADPVSLDLGLVRIGDLALVKTDANVSPSVGQKLLRQSPVRHTWITALTFGPFRFIVDDAAYAQNTYEATATTAKKGCAEPGYLSKSLEMFGQR